MWIFTSTKITATHEALGVEPEGMVRIGLCHYNTQGEIVRLLKHLASL